MSRPRKSLGHHPRGDFVEPAPSTSARMRRVRQAGTEPELAVRRILTRLGARYRVCVSDLPGRPDVANCSRGWAIFVHGCFWHGHEGCKLFTKPKTNSAFWETKVRANQARDQRKERDLVQAGFRVAVVWQCELEDAAALEARLKRFLESE